MANNLREKRSISSRANTSINSRPRRSVLSERQTESIGTNNDSPRELIKKTRSSVSSRRIRDTSPEPEIDQFEEKNSNESLSGSDEDENAHGKCRTSVSFNIKNEEVTDEDDDDEGEENETLQADTENGNSSVTEKRKQSLERARLARKWTRKRRKSHQKNTEKMNTSINNLNESQTSYNGGISDNNRSNKYVQVHHIHKQLNLNTFEPIEFMYEVTKDSSSSTSSVISNHSYSKPFAQQPAPALPKVNIEIINDNPECTDQFKLPGNYIKFVEKNNEELEEEVEYDMDEEDNLWLQFMNESRLKSDPSLVNQITQEQFEILMDRLEKESYFQTSASTQVKSPEKNRSLNDSSLNNSKTNNDSSNEDALCCICLDGEGYNSNAILFCDMCNLAVHQECYGVPYIPEGQWLCRRCIQSPSAQVQCILCPNRYGAFKQTDSGLWAHVFCAIWIPEVHFANTVFLEPVIGIENIDRARWKLMCYICRKRNVGACIQCDKFNCYTAFHVTCAQQAGLYMNIREETPEEDQIIRRKKNGKKDQRYRQNSSNGSFSGEVRRVAYCDIHTPLEVLSPRTRKAIGVSENTSTANMGAECEEAMKNAQKLRMKKARKILAERRNAPPQVCMPVVPKEKTENIISRVEFEKKDEFFEKLTNYWLLKRYSRNGVPILRRLQTMGLKNKKAEQSENKEPSKLSPNKNDMTVEEKTRFYEDMKEQLTYWKRLRQGLEKARLLMELIRKREKQKREIIKIDHLKAIYEINPLNGIFLQRLIDLLRQMDSSKIFHEPVDAEAVPSYYETIQNPMDFSKMQLKLNSMKYECISQFESDFNLMISNCLHFNPKKSFYYNIAYKFRDQAAILMKQAKILCAENNLNLPVALKENNEQK